MLQNFAPVVKLFFSAEHSDVPFKQFKTNKLNIASGSILLHNINYRLEAVLRDCLFWIEMINNIVQY